MTQQTKFSVGNLVQIVDPEESCYEWATFVITNFDSGCYLLSGLDKFTYEPLWVTSYEIGIRRLLFFNFSFSFLGKEQLSRVRASQTLLTTLRMSH